MQQKYKVSNPELSTLEKCFFILFVTFSMPMIVDYMMIGYCRSSEHIIVNNEIMRKCNETQCEYLIIIEVEFYRGRKFEVFQSTNYEGTIILSKEKYSTGQKINIYCYRDIFSWTTERYCDSVGHIDKRKEFFTQYYILSIIMFPVLPTLLCGLWIIMSCLSKPMDMVALSKRKSTKTNRLIGKEN